jgi:trk system potassium uptake protein TrkH
MVIAPKQLTPAQLLTVSIAALVAGGTLLLRLPVSAAREPLSLIDAFVTSTSAVCVTGLTVVDTSIDLSLFGQVILMLLIQAGGLGYMAITTVVAVALGRQLSVHERITLQEALNVETMDGLIRFTLTVFKLTLALELAGAALLAARWAGDLGLPRAAYFGLFHAVSAFNNAGFSLFSDNLVRYRGDLVVNLVVTGLIIAGGLGFVVLSEIGRARRGGRLTLHTRLVLGLSALLIAAGTLLILGIEARNARTLGPLPWWEALLAAYFQSVSARTAGFNTMDIGAMAPASLFIVILLMFIGASPGGTGGGVKTTTFAIAMAALWAMVRGGTEPTILRRRLAPMVVTRAFFIALIAFLAVNAIVLALLLTEGRDLLPTLFETTSAFGTVGLSTGQKGSVLSLVGHFSTAGKVLIAAMMFMGRVGPLTLAVAVARRASQPRVRYPEGRILIG